MTGFKSKKAAAQDKLAQPAQEPFGYLSIEDNPVFQKETPEIGQWKTLYTAPPQRSWVDLTENEIEVIEEMALTKAWAIRMAMAHLKERNT